MSGPPTKRNDWLTPQTMIAAAGMALGVFGSVQAFQRDSEARMIRVEGRMESAEAARKEQEERLRGLERENADLNIRLDRLEHRQN